MIGHADGGGRARAGLAIVPLLLVNIVAVSGQLAFLRDHLPWGLPGDVAFAVALESIAVYLAYHAHVALLGNDSALRLRLASYGFGLAIGCMNYSHYAGPRLRPTFAACAIGLMSASSPWLWAVHSRRTSRDALLRAGLIEPHALRLGPTRWSWHPIRSARVMWWATWEGVQLPADAIEGHATARQRRAGQHQRAAHAVAAGTPAGLEQRWEQERGPAEVSPPAPAIEIDPAALAALPSEAARVRYASGQLKSRHVGTIAAGLERAGWPASTENVRKIMSRARHERERGGQLIQLPRAASPQDN